MPLEAPCKLHEEKNAISNSMQAAWRLLKAYFCIPLWHFTQKTAFIAKKFPVWFTFYIIYVIFAIEFVQCVSDEEEYKPKKLK